MHNPLFSIIIPSFNQGRYIRETIESCLLQEYRPIEVLIIDGASTDGTVEVLHEYDNVPELSWVSEPDSGVVDAVNKGLSKARGEIGAIQSSDDYYLPGAFQIGVQQLLDHHRCGFVFGDIVKIDEHGKTLMAETLRPFSVEGVLSGQTWIPQPSCFFRLGLAKELGGWRESVPYAPDTDLWFRMMLHAEAYKFDVAISKRRMHGQQRDTQGEKILRDYCQVVSDWFSEFGAPEGLRPAADAGVYLMRSRYSRQEDACQTAIQRFPVLRDHLCPTPTKVLMRQLCSRILGKLAGNRANRINA